MDTVGVSDSSLLVSDSVAVAGSLVDVSVLLGAELDVVALVSEPGARASDGAVEVADVSADSLAVVSADVVSGVEAAVLGAVVVIGACEAVVTSASLGSVGATVVDGASTVASADAVACVSGRGTWVAGTGTWVCGACGASAGASGATSSSGAVASGSGATTVVVTALSSPGWANAGAMPPVSAVREITTPDASTATTPRFEQISMGAPTVYRSFGHKARYAVHRCCQGSHRPPMLCLETEAVACSSLRRFIAASTEVLHTDRGGGRCVTWASG
jgi:hypothetical protein